MKKRRLIPLILIKNGIVVQSRNFNEFQKIGMPKTSVKRCSEWGSDELILLDISRENKYNNRDDLNFVKNNNFIDIVLDISKSCFMPITVGGKVRSLQDIENYLISGADKVAINTSAVLNPKLLDLASKRFGSQCIVNSVDVKLINNRYVVCINNGSEITSYELKEWLKISEQNGTGEILINSIDNDGRGNGFDLNLIDLVVSNTNVPVICCGGAGRFEHFLEVAEKTNVDGIAAANFFQHVDQSVFLTKKVLYEKNFNFREPKFLNI
jgi:imidazole glycerol-phosphate synthase subunit HisF